ncbi:hypothetical protein CA850_06290 [Micromonospora echinospora]|uniref:DUF3558 domain-containing protein n=1 Tax=Micromonospora echinospora TaxID=1877 RepID=A0A1C4V5Q6_MICEC|nr:hypothetical protein [Micromonospora echinospora]OZV83102.1 hypothetical protein CA850_06290 [Micromonospora echinospora]SCE79277.1 hypothetical protein GA0070618_0970 [Micromonospora echinospora]
MSSDRQHARVMGSARLRHPGTRVITLLTTATLLGATGCASEPDPETTVAARTTTAPGVCANAFQPLGDKPSQTRKGDLVPAGARDALLCTYAAPDGGTNWALSGSMKLPTDRTESLISYLNGLPEWQATEGEADGCLLGGDAARQIVLDYGDQPQATVTIDCGVASQDGAVRRFTSMKRLLEYWPSA